MADPNANLLPLAALQNLVGRNSMNNDVEEPSVNDSLMNMPSLSNNSSITITKTKAGSGQFSNGSSLLENFKEIESNKDKYFNLSLLNNPSCTITRVSCQDDDSNSSKNVKSNDHFNGEDNLNSFNLLSHFDKVNVESPQNISNLGQIRSSSMEVEAVASPVYVEQRSSSVLEKSSDCIIRESLSIKSISGNEFSDLAKRDMLNISEAVDCRSNWSENIAMKGNNDATDERGIQPTSSISIDRVLGNDDPLSNIFESSDISTNMMETDDACETNMDIESNNTESETNTLSIISKDSLVKNSNDIKSDTKEEDKSEASNPLSDSDSNGNGGVSGISSICEFKWDAVTCIFCGSNIGDQEPKLLPCLHSACGKCLTREASEAAHNKDEDIVEMFPLIYCPSCKKGFAQDAVIDNMFVSEVYEKESMTETNYCTSCSDEEAASGFCTDCCEWLCDACIQAHKRVKVTKDHIIKVKDSTAKSQPRKNLFCSTHTKEQLNLYCVTCDQLTCRDCQLMEHRDHKYKFSIEMASQTKEKLHKLVRDIRKKRSYIEAAKDLVTERRQQLVKRQETVKSEINRLIDTFVDIIRQRGQVLNDQIREVSNTKEEQLDKKTEVLNHLEKQANHCISVVESTLESSSELSLLYSKKLLMDHVLKVDKDSPDISLFDRFKAKLNSGDEISLRISNESRGLGKALKDVGYLLVDNRVYPVSQESNRDPGSSSHSQASKIRSSQPSPVSESPSPRPSSQPTLTATPVQPVVTTVSGKTTPTYMPSFSMSQPPMMTPQPPTLTPMHAHHQQQQMMQNPSGMHKFHNFAPCGTTNPPGLVRIQPKPQLMHNMNCGQPTMKPVHMGHALGGFPRMPQLTPQSVRHADVSSVSSSTHPLGDTNHLRGLLGSGGSYKMGGYPQLMRLPQPNNQPFPPPQHSPQPPTQMQQQQQRMMEQSRRGPGPNMIFDPLNSQLAMAAVGMAPPMMTTPMPSMNHPRPPMTQIMRTSQPMSMPSRDSSRQASPHSTQATKHSGCSSPSWHTPHTAPHAANGTVSTQPFDNSFKIMLGMASVAPTVPSLGRTFNSDGKSNEGVSSSSANNFKMEKTKDANYEGSPVPDDNTKSALSVLSSLVGDSPIKESCLVGGPDSSSPRRPICSTEKTAVTGTPTKNEEGDPNDDWCAVCWDGGDLVCCDYCPKVFHTNCHIPSLSHIPKAMDKWQCMICRDISQLPDKLMDDDLGGKRKFNVPMTPKQLKIAQRILLELYCNYEASQPFRELVDRELTEYYEIIQNPMALEIIKKKLKPDSIDHYTCLEDYVKDIKLIFKNCYEFNPRETEIYQNARILEDFFNQLVEKWLSDINLSDCDVGNDDLTQGRKKMKGDIMHIS